MLHQVNSNMPILSIANLEIVLLRLINKQSRLIGLQKGEIWTSKRLHVRRQDDTGNKEGVNTRGRGQAGCLNMLHLRKRDIKSRSTGSRSFSSSLVEEEEAENIITVCIWLCGSPGGDPSSGLSSHSSWVIDQQCIQGHRAVTYQKSLYSVWLFGYLLFAFMHK